MNKHYRLTVHLKDVQKTEVTSGRVKNAKGKFVDNLFYYSGQDNINHSSSDWPFLEIKDVGNPKMINLAKYTDTSKDTSIALIDKIKWNLVLTFSEIENGILVFKKVIKLSELNI